MDLNQLLFQHQAALLQRGAQGPKDTPFLSCDLVRHYHKRIARLREELGVAPYPDCSGNIAHGMAPA
ncbi:hypothetical protein OLX02_12220 [Novosphingobium sp. KCTC 2891]|uniref:hypothetical protein n=1 Tax=Novosphingobium sp. KCTC 2891 TaxID=2989730 RepID=UPI002221F26D|nr:hypothetical protein [Novosphingobium sp. KCTC 2891]MCW1383585.1 hypothetical protein [Novosphingobium sp. KCTC 2891]